jgi:hypothetical protein
MKKFVQALLSLGVTTGPTFRLRHEDGVGMIIEPNPQPNRMQPSTVPVATAKRIDGTWTARQVHATDRFPFLH